MATLYITADRKRFVPAGDPDAAFGVAEADIDREGLREAYDEFTKPKAMPRSPNKMASPPLDKAYKRSSNKSKREGA